MDLNDYRTKIDKIDEQIVKLIAKRMDVAADIAAYKKENGLPLIDATRERQKLADLARLAPDGMKEYTQLFYSLMFDLSRSYQGRLVGTTSALPNKINDALENTPKLFPSGVSVVCQGVEGAYQQMACDRVFKNPCISYVNSFEEVFTAIEDGVAKYGVLPLENSTAGSVNTIYDLMMKHKFYIVRSVRLKIDHNLLVNPGTKLEDIKEIYSHPQALLQCANYLKKFPNARVIPSENTAVAAKMVSASGRNDIACLSSRNCMKLYGLRCLESSVQDQANNYTRFICITRHLEIYPGADRTSLMATLPHTPGALYKMLSRFYAQGINLNKLESRPIPDRDFEFMFYFDLEASVYSPAFMDLMGEMKNLCETFTYLGTYSEVI